MTWESNLPAEKGLPWFVSRKAGQVLDSVSRAGAVLFSSTLAETIDHISVYLKNVVGNATYRLHAFSLANFNNVTPTTTSFFPTVDVAQSGVTGTPVNTAGNLYQNIDDASGASDYIAFAPTGSYYCRLGTGTGLGAGAQTVSKVRWHLFLQHSSLPSYLTIALYNGTTQVTVGTVNMFHNWVQDNFDVYFDMATNPFTGVAWTEADIVNFSATYSLRLIGDGSANATLNTVFSVEMLVTWANDPNLFTPVDATPTADGWLSFTLSGNWAKGLGTTYALMLHKVTGDGTAVWAALDAAAPPKGDMSYSPSLDSSGGLIATLNATLTLDFAYVMHTTAPGPSVDSQPYNNMFRTPVDASNTVRQQWTEPVAAQTRQFVTFMAGSTRHQAPAADLTVKIKRGSDNAQMGGTGTVQVSDISGAYYPLQLVECLQLTGAVLASGIQYYLELSCTAPAGTGWDVPMLDTKAPPVTADTVGYGGTTDQGSLNGAAYNPDYDMPMIVAAGPTAPVAVGAISA